MGIIVIEQVLLILGASIFGLLGFIHLLFTFFTNKFDAFDPTTTKAMRDTSPVLTKETTMWEAWIGFNASHSLGAMLVMAFYVPLVLTNMQIIRESVWFSILPVAIGLFYLALAKRYWFKIPFFGILVSTICFVGAAISINT
jgi:hypothetical protein